MSGVRSLHSLRSVGMTVSIGLNSASLNVYEHFNSVHMRS